VAVTPPAAAADIRAAVVAEAITRPDDFDNVRVGGEKGALSSAAFFTLQA
jgi:hypothetical protein